MPMPRSPAWLKLSPESFSTTRLNGGCGSAGHALSVQSDMIAVSKLCFTCRRLADSVQSGPNLDLHYLPQFPVHELLHLHPLALGVLADRHAVLLHERLLEQGTSRRRSSSAGLRPSCRRCSRACLRPGRRRVRISRSLATTAGSSSSLLTASGRMAAMCMLTSLAASSVPPSTPHQHAADGAGSCGCSRRCRRRSGRCGRR